MSSTIKVSSPKSGREIVIEKDFGENLDESVKLFGAAVVHSNFVRMCNTDASNKARAMLNDEKVSVETVLTAIANWTPGVVTRSSVPKMSLIDSFKARIANAKTPEEKAVIKAELKELLDLTK